MCEDLDMYFDGYVYIVAQSPRDAIDIWNSHIGDNHIEGFYGACESWRVIPRENDFGLFFEEYPDFTEYPSGALVSEGGEFNPYTARSTVEKWIELFGRGYFCDLYR